MNNLAPMKSCPGGMQGNLNWMPGYHLRRISMDPKISLNVFCLPVDPISLRHNFDSCDATPNTALTGTMLLSKLK